MSTLLTTSPPPSTRHSFASHAVLVKAFKQRWMFPPISILTPRRIFKTTILTNPNDGKREKVPPNHFKHSVEHYVPTQGLPVCPLSRIAHTMMFFPSTASNLRIDTSKRLLVTGLVKAQVVVYCRPRNFDTQTSPLSNQHRGRQSVSEASRHVCWIYLSCVVSPSRCLRWRAWPLGVRFHRKQRLARRRTGALCAQSSGKSRASDSFLAVSNIEPQQQKQVSIFDTN